MNGLLVSFFSYSHNDPIAQLLARVRSLEDANNATVVPARLLKITQFGLQREEDFDMYVALAMAEQLTTAANSAGDEKPPTYNAIACTLREKLPVPIHSVYCWLTRSRPCWLTRSTPEYFSLQLQWGHNPAFPSFILKGFLLRLPRSWPYCYKVL